jgi:hypothetical protein
VSNDISCLCIIYYTRPVKNELQPPAVKKLLKGTGCLESHVNKMVHYIISVVLEVILLIFSGV